jgi:acetolactate synthase-1/2/3 large subunit
MSVFPISCTKESVVPGSAAREAVTQEKCCKESAIPERRTKESVRPERCTKEKGSRNGEDVLRITSPKSLEGIAQKEAVDLGARMTGARMILEAFKAEGVEVVFGYPGGAVLPLYDALYDSGLKHVLTRHEAGAAHAADGYARSTGKVGVCIATSGPGATNLVTGIANAYMDSVPLVAFTGQVALPLLGRDSFQEVDITGVTLPITKHNYIVKDLSNLPRVIKEAFHIARTGRPGPVLIDVPKNITQSEGYFRYPKEVSLRGYRPVFEGLTESIEKAAAKIAGAKRPVLFVGGGVTTSGTWGKVKELVDMTGIPVVSSLMGLGNFPGDDPLFLGMLGMHGTYAANMAVTECDLLIGVGVRFDDRVTGKVDGFAPRAKIIHMDIDPAEIGKNTRVDMPVVGDLRWSLPALLDCLEGYGFRNGACGGGSIRKWQETVATWKAEYPLIYRPSDPDAEGSIKPQYVTEELCKITGGNAVVVTDVGQHQMWAAQYYTYKRPRSLITSGGLGTMGYGLPAAIGAQIGRPYEAVFLISGDGSLLMNCQELVTAQEQRLPVKILVFNNMYLGMVRQWQELFFGKRYSHSCLNGSADYVKMAEAFGCKGLRITKARDVGAGINEAISHDGPVVIDFRVCPEENVLPMVPAGGSLDNMMHCEPEDVLRITGGQR